MAGGERKAKVSIGGDTTGLDKALARSKSNLNKWAGGVRTEIGGALRGAFAGLGDVAGFTGLGSIALAARETKLWNDRLVALQQTTGNSRRQILGMNEAIQATALATGVQQQDLLSGIEKFQEVTGEASKFSDALVDMANVSTATNAKMDDIAATAAAVSQALGVSSRDLGRMFDVLAVQGDRGAVELKNLASMMPQLAAMAGKFKTQGVEGVAEWGAMMQVVKRGTGTASEALTQTVDLAAALLTHWKKLEKGGVQVFSDKEHKKTRDILDIVDDINKKIPRSRLADTDFMGQRKEALFAYDSIVKYRRELASLQTTADKTGAIVRKNQDYNASSTAAFNRAMTSLHKTANDLWMGSLPQLASAFERVAAALKWMIDHQAAVISMLVAWKAASGLLALTSAGAAAAGAGGGAAGVAGAAARVAAGAGAGAAGGVVGALGTGVGTLGAAGIAGIATIAVAVIGSAAVGVAIGSVISSLSEKGPANVNHKAYDNPYSEYQLKRRFALGEHENEANAVDFALGQSARPYQSERYRDTIQEPGSAASLYPGAPGIRKDESAADYTKRQGKIFDTQSQTNVVVEQLRMILAELQKAAVQQHSAQMIVDLTTMNDKIALKIANNKQRRRSP